MKVQFPSVVAARHVTGEVKVFSAVVQIECPPRRLRFPRCQGSCEVDGLLPFQVKMIKALAFSPKTSSEARLRIYSVIYFDSDFFNFDKNRKTTSSFVAQSQCVKLLLSDEISCSANRQSWVLTGPLLSHFPCCESCPFHCLPPLTSKTAAAVMDGVLSLGLK